MKITSKIKLHPLFYIVVIIFIFTGHFHDFFLFLSIILFHEMGHIIGGLLFKWKIKEVLILPFGSLTNFDEGLNKPLKEEFLISILGPLFQVVYYLLLKNKLDISLIHYSLLLFNLLPIIPLDGSKIFNTIFNKLFPFKKSYILTLFLSICLIGCLYIYSFFKFNLLIILILLFLSLRVYKDFIYIEYILEKFLYERYYIKRNYKKIKKVKGINLSKIYKDYRHLFYTPEKCYTEREILRKMFDFKDKL